MPTVTTPALPPNPPAPGHLRPRLRWRVLATAALPALLGGAHLAKWHTLAHDPHVIPALATLTTDTGLLSFLPTASDAPGQLRLALGDGRTVTLHCTSHFQPRNRHDRCDGLDLSLGQLRDATATVWWEPRTGLFGTAEGRVYQVLAGRTALLSYGHAATVYALADEQAKLGAPEMLRLAELFLLLAAALLPFAVRWRRR